MQNFVYLVGCERTREVALVDPAWAIDPLLEQIEELGYRPVAALVTHYHPDHIGGSIQGQQIEGLPELLARQGMKVYVHTTVGDGVIRVTGISENDLVRVESAITLDNHRNVVAAMQVPIARLARFHDQIPDLHS